MENVSKNYNEGLNVPSQLPDLRRILEALQKQSDLQSELVSKSFCIANNVKNFEPLNNKEEVTQKSSTCMVDYFWEVTYRIEKQNFLLQQSLEHLGQVIGV
jgi:hypothetical protein